MILQESTLPLAFCDYAHSRDGVRRTLKNCDQRPLTGIPRIHGNPFYLHRPCENSSVLLRSLRPTRRLDQGASSLRLRKGAIQ